MIPAAPDVVWAALEAHVAAMLASRATLGVARVLGCEPPAGFAVVESVPPARMTLEGRHRFARYRLGFVLEAVPAGTRLGAASWAAFPGAAGRLYRAAVIGTRGHVVAVERLLRGIQQRAARTPHGTMPGLNPDQEA